MRPPGPPRTRHAAPRTSGAGRAALSEQLRGQELTVRALQGGYGPSVGVSAGEFQLATARSQLLKALGRP